MILASPSASVSLQAAFAAANAAICCSKRAMCDCGMSRRSEHQPLDLNRVAFQGRRQQIGRCIRGTRPSLRCRRAGRQARSPSCASPGREAGPVLTALAGKVPLPRMATRAAAPRCQPAADRRCGGALVSRVRPARTGEDVAEFHVHGGRAGAGRAVRGAAAHLDNVRAGGARRIHPPRVRERQARSHRRPKVSTISSTPTPIANAARHCVS